MKREEMLMHLAMEEDFLVFELKKRRNTDKEGYERLLEKYLKLKELMALCLDDNINESEIQSRFEESSI